MKYFVLNKELDFKRGVLCACQWREGRLSLLPHAGQGAFLSRVFDSRELQNTWHRFILKGQGPGRASLLFTFYGTDTLEVTIEGRRRLLPEFLADVSDSVLEKKELLKPWEKKQALFPEDILLHEVKGRYLFFLAELFAQGEEAPFIEEMTLYFPMDTWLKYLPGVYSRKEAGADFTSRYLGIFQSIYEDMDWKIRNSSRMLNEKDTRYEYLEQIASWFQMKNMDLWPENRLRKLLGQMRELFARTGTVPGMLGLLELYTGERPILIECGRMQGEKERKMYGVNPYECILLIKEKYMRTDREYKALICLIDQMKPAYMQVTVFPLKPQIVLGSHTYLGMNSQIAGFEPMTLDGRALLAFSSVGRKDCDSLEGERE